jgi:flagellar biosynthesis protein FlhF
MRIKRFVAPDMRTVFRMVREEQGADAVILSNRAVDGGIEVVAATDYDEALVQQALRSAMPPPRRPATALDDAPDADPSLPVRLAGALRGREAEGAGIPAPSFARQLADAQAAAPAPAASQSRADAMLAALGQRAAAPAAPARAAAPAAAAPARAATSTAAAAADRAAAEAAHAVAERAAARVAAAEEAARQHAAAAAAAEAQAAAQAEADAAARAAARSGAAPFREPAAAPVLAAVPVRISPWDEDPSLVQVRDELSQMRAMIEREMQRMNDERMRGSPVRAAALDALASYGCDEQLARAVALKIPPDAEAGRGRGLMLGLLSKMLPITEVDPLHEGGVIALVGPTGAGKTTTIAKLAARFAAEHGPREVALVTTDIHRPGGREQLHTYGRMLGLTVVEAGTEEALRQTLDRLAAYRLVLIDTAGLGQRDRTLVGQLGWLRNARRVKPLLCMPANAQAGDLDEVVRRFRGVAPEGVVLTKLDETGRLGGALSVLVRHGLPLAWTTDGQQVPEDLARADATRLVLRLEELRRAAERPTDDAEDTHVAA